MGAGSSQPAHQQHRRSQPARPPQYYPPVPYSVPAGAVPQAPYGHAPYPYGYAYHPQAGGGVSPSSWQHNPHYPHPPPAAPWYGGYPGHAPPPYQVPVPPMMPAPPPPVVAEPQQAVTIRNEVNVKRSSLRLLRDPADPSKHLVAFTFDATTSGSVSVFFAAQEGEGCSLRGVYPHVHTPKVVRFAKGLGQKFVQPSGTGVDLSVIPEEHLFRVSSPSPVYPLVIRTRVEPRSSKSATVASPNSSASSGVSNVQSSAPASASSSEPCSVGSHGVESCDSDPGAPLPPSVQSQMTYAVLEKAAVARTEKEGEGETAEGDKGKGTGELPGLFVVRPVKQKIWVDGTSYEVQEIYGIEQCGRANPGRSKKGEAEGAGGQGSALSDEEEEEEDEVAGKECVICMSAPRDTTVLPCRHMCMCADCAKVLRYQTNKCPICRQPVQSLLEIRVPPRLPSLDGPEPTSPEAQGEAAAERQGHAEACAGPPLAGSDRRADPRSAAAHAGSGAAEEGGSRGHGEASRGVDSAAGRSAVLPFAPGAAAQGRPDAVAKLPGQPASAPKFNQSAGYITVDGRKAYFYWLVEAIGQPDSKPLLLWLNGGPGCSSVGCGLFEEVGPWRVASKAGAALLYNKYAWNRPKDNHAFLVGFVARHPRYAGREFYIAGESYAGKGESYAGKGESYAGKGESCGGKGESCGGKGGSYGGKGGSYAGKGESCAGKGESYAGRGPLCPSHSHPMPSPLAMLPSHPSHPVSFSAGHYIPQLAARIIEQNQIQGGTRLNLDFSGIFLGNPFGPIQFFYDHGMLSTDLYNHAINCDFTYGAPNLECRYHINSAFSPWVRAMPCHASLLACLRPSLSPSHTSLSHSPVEFTSPSTPIVSTRTITITTSLVLSHHHVSCAVSSPRLLCCLITTSLVLSHHHVSCAVSSHPRFSPRTPHAPQTPPVLSPPLSCSHLLSPRDTSSRLLSPTRTSSPFLLSHHPPYHLSPPDIYAPYCLADIASARLSASARMNPRLRYSIAALQAAIQQQQQAAQAQAAAGIGELAAPRGAGSSGKAMDPLDSPACMDAWVQRYLRSPAVYRTLRAPAVRASQWSLCSNGIDYSAANQGSDIIPTIAALLDQPIRFWIFAGDADSVVPFTGTRVWIEALGLPVLQPHYPWLMPSGQVGGWATRYDKLTWVTVRGAGHQVPTGKPEEAFVLFQSFLLAQDPPSTAQW
ncbi:unnamed protein product [Closterium sp. NIES-65]|nr:unnamed protein product [Closterium sp. NIES-65]